MEACGPVIECRGSPLGVQPKVIATDPMLELPTIPVAYEYVNGGACSLGVASPRYIHYRLLAV